MDEKNFIEDTEEELDLPELRSREQKHDSQDPVYLRFLDDDTKTMKIDAAEIPDHIPTGIPWDTEDEPGRRDGGKKKMMILLIIILAAVLTAACGFLYLESRKEQKPSYTPSADRTPLVTPTPSAEPTAVPEETPVTETAAPTPAVYGTLTVNADSIKKRDVPSLNGNELGSAVAGETYQVLNIQEADGYTWYEIAENTWIASEGTWVSYTAPQG